MAKRFRKLNVDFEMLFADNGVPHGFLNMKNLADETNEAHSEVVEMLKTLVNQFK